MQTRSRRDLVQEAAPRVVYVYPQQLPSVTAAPITILSTCRALAAAGASVTLYSGGLGRSAAECLSFYGLASHENLRLEPVRSWREIERRLDCDLSGAEEAFVLSRGDFGVRLFRELARDRPRGRRFVFESHRLGYARAAERSRRVRRSWRAPGAVLRARRERSLEAAAVTNADALVCLTAGVREALEMRFQPRCPVLVLPLGVIIPETLPTGEPRDIDLLYAGKLAARKNVLLFLDVMRFLPEYRLWILGGTPREARRLEDEARRRRAGNVHVHGFVEPARVPQFLRRARAGVLPLPVGTSFAGASLTPDFYTGSLRALELMANGVAVVAGRLPSSSALLEHERTALLVEGDDPGKIALGVRRILTDPALAERLSRAAFEKVSTFSWERRARRLLEFLRGL